MTHRRVLRGGMVADGIGHDLRCADVLLIDDTIDAVSPHLGTVEAEIIDLGPDDVVCPGFIDGHVHAEGPLLADGYVEGALAQGVTTLVVGQDGSSWIGGDAETVHYLNVYFGPVNGTYPDDGPCSVADYRDAVTGRLRQNVAVLASQGTIRHNLTGVTDRPLTDHELKAARLQLEQSLAAGAVGASSGLDYVPSRYAQLDELAAFAEPLADAHRPFVSHLRAYGARVGDGLEELIQIGRRTGAAVHASHLWGAPADIEKAVDRAEQLDVRLTFDMYPYVRSSTILAMAVIPAELQRGGVTATLRRLADPAVRRDLLATDPFTASSLGLLTLASLPPRLAQYAGRTPVDAARDADRSPGEWTLDLLLDSSLQVGVNIGRPALTDEHLSWIARHPLHCVGSDGIYQGQCPHPRGYGAFARAAGAYSGGDGRLDYQTMVRHLSTNTADAYGLDARGRLAPGHAADICILSPSGMAENATDDAPTAPSSGVRAVLVNGTPTFGDWTTDAQPSPGAVISH